jgi:hypothetical protein
MFIPRRDRLAKAGALVAVAVMTTALAACGGGGSGSGSGASSGAAQHAGGASSGSDPQFQWELKFTTCLRDHGIDIADPDPVQGVPAVAHDDAYNTASKACQGKVGKPPSAAGMGNGDQVRPKLLKQVQCLRDHGLDVPDPGPRDAPAIPQGASEDVVKACFAPDAK